MVAIFGFYMALGPSLKINSIKPEILRQTSPDQLSAVMAPEFALAPTGNAWISKKLPGFKLMRASYRWIALSIFCFWILLVIFLAKRYPKNRFLPGFLLIGFMGLNLPNLHHQWTDYVAARQTFLYIDSELLPSFQKVLHPHERVAFLPYRNDFMLNYLASRLRVSTCVQYR